jgi:outer membrane biosynthesis protein TonB
MRASLGTPAPITPPASPGEPPPEEMPQGPEGPEPGVVPDYPPPEEEPQPAVIPDQPHQPLPAEDPLPIEPEPEPNPEPAHRLAGARATAAIASMLSARRRRVTGLATRHASTPGSLRSPSHRSTRYRARRVTRLAVIEPG